MCRGGFPPLPSLPRPQPATPPSAQSLPGPAAPRPTLCGPHAWAAWSLWAFPGAVPPEGACSRPATRGLRAAGAAGWAAGAAAPRSVRLPALWPESWGLSRAQQEGAGGVSSPPFPHGQVTLLPTPLLPRRQAGDPAPSPRRWQHVIAALPLPGRWLRKDCNAVFPAVTMEARGRQARALRPSPTPASGRGGRGRFPPAGQGGALEAGPGRCSSGWLPGGGAEDAGAAGTRALTPVPAHAAAGERRGL